MNKKTWLEASELLENAGISPSYQRLMVLASLLESDEHPSADALFKQLGSNVPAISRATVYNTLNILVEKGVIRPLHTAGAETHFDSVYETHGHFFCRECKKIYDIPQQNTETKAEIDGHLVESQELVYTGLCKKCRGQMKN